MTAPYEPSHQDFHCLLSKLILYSNNLSMKQTRSLFEFSCLSEDNQLYPNILLFRRSTADNPEEGQIKNEGAKGPTTLCIDLKTLRGS